MAAEGRASRASRFNPFVAVRRSWRRFVRRPTLMQLRTVGISGAVLAGLVIYAVVSPAANGGGGSSQAGLGASAAASTVQSTPGVTPPSRASTSTRGVSAHSINVVFPVSNLTSLSSQIGFAGDIEFGEQVKAIRLYVNQINQAGGIHGRKINPIIPNYDPTNESGMRALCKTYTEGCPAAFAMVDGIGSWTGDNQLCVTQEGQTPFIGQWTTVTNWTTIGSPYLWWTGPDQSTILSTLVDWGLSDGLIGFGHKVGVIVGDRASDKLALRPVPAPRPGAGRDQPRGRAPSPPTRPTRPPPTPRRRWWSSRCGAPG